MNLFVSRFYKMIILIAIIFQSESLLAQSALEDKIRFAVERQMQMFPQSTLQDLYKSFFQDKFGPEHIISDYSSAGEYLRKELNLRDNFEGIMFEPCGYEGNYYRVNLAVVKLNYIDYQDFFSAFLQSANSENQISLEEWKKEWALIQKVIYSVVPDLEGFSADSVKIAEILSTGNYAVHHSKQYNSAYDPHYRIIEKSIFEKSILPKLK